MRFWNWKFKDGSNVLVSFLIPAVLAVAWAILLIAYVVTK